VIRRSVPLRPSEAAVVGVVGSTGAPRVLRDLLAGLPADSPAPFAVVQHTPVRVLRPSKTHSK
jgi:chemotaxis response regulator CheB